MDSIEMIGKDLKDKVLDDVKPEDAELAYAVIDLLGQFLQQVRDTERHLASIAWSLSEK